MHSKHRIFSVLALLAAQAAGTVFALGASELVAVDTGGLEARSAALILSGQEGGDLEAHVFAFPLPGEEQPFTVSLWVEIAGQTLLAEVGEGDLLTEIYAYALTPENEIAGFLTRAIRFDLATYGDELSTGGIQFQGQMELFAGEYSLRVLVLQRSSSRFSVKVVDLEVPTWSTGGSQALPLLLLEQQAPAVRVRAESATVSLFPLRFADQSWVPSPALIDPKVARSLYVAGRGLPAELDVRLLDGGGEVRQRLELTLTEAVEVDLAGLDLVRLSLPALEMPQGAYRLEVSLSGETESFATRAVRLLEVSEEDPETALAELATARRDADAAEVANPKLTRREALYLGALGRLAEGGAAAARSALRELEDAEIGPGSSQKRRKELLQSQVNVAIRLAKRDPKALIPLIAFHEDLYRRHHKAGEFQLSTHCRNLLALLNRLYMERNSGAEAARLVAATMVSLGDYMLEHGSNLAAKKAFERALENDPAQVAALLGVAGIEENYGLYEDAVEKLRQLTKLQSGNHEARLRLAINLGRIDKAEEAERLLRVGIAEGMPEWIAVLSYQELGNLCFDNRREQEAVDLLKEAAERFPEQQRLHLQVAALLDRMGRPIEAQEALAGLDPNRGKNVDTPRMLYGLRSKWLAAATRRSLVKESQRHLPILAATISQTLGREENALSP
jgi:predicted Zn-dependent protease